MQARAARASSAVAVSRAPRLRASAPTATSARAAGDDPLGAHRDEVAQVAGEGGCAARRGRRRAGRPRRGGGARRSGPRGPARPRRGHPGEQRHHGDGQPDPDAERVDGGLAPAALATPAARGASAE